jgi:hypothetical protein
MTDIDICNQALGWLGAKRITSFNDGTNESQLCSDNYEPLRDACLEERAWTFADASITLDNATPGDWDNGENQYELPGNVIRVYRAFRDVSRRNPVQLEGWRREGNNVVVRFSGQIYIKATIQIVDPDEFTAGFRQVVAARLAADLAMPITRSRKMQEDMWSLFQSKLDSAAATDAGQARSERTDSTELVRARFSDGLQDFR